jgi:hypothetical protein
MSHLITPDVLYRLNPSWWSRLGLATLTALASCSMEPTDCAQAFCNLTNKEHHAAYDRNREQTGEQYAAIALNWRRVIQGHAVPALRASEVVIFVAIICLGANVVARFFACQQ